VAASRATRKPALARAAPAFALGWLEPLRDFLRLLKVFGRGAPEEQASGYFSDRHRYTQLCGHAEDAVLHRVRACTVGDRHAHGLISQQLDLRPQLLIELWVHAGPPAHTAGFVERDVFELNR
jgi:hypothetical protein